ncbi:hypothetical protein Skr01_32480 [Sphaerisporangium krabiense]|nr:hypothetical protein Skr01_32480 [Sphaerisporangium krabiense]
MCCTTPGMDATGCGSLTPSFTNIGSTSSAGCSRVPATMRRIGTVLRSLRGRATGKPALLIVSPLPDLVPYRRAGGNVTMGMSA